MPPFSTLPIIPTNLVPIIQHPYHVCQAGFVQGMGMGGDMVTHPGWQELGVWGNHRRPGNALPVLGIHEVAMEGVLAVLQTSLCNTGNTIGSQLGKLDKTQSKRSSCMPPNTKMRRRPTLPPRHQGSTIHTSLRAGSHTTGTNSHLQLHQKHLPRPHILQPQCGGAPPIGNP